MLTSHAIASFMDNFKKDIGILDAKRKPKDIGVSRIAVDEANVKLCFNVIREWK